MFSVSNVTTGIPSAAVKKPGVWTPSGGTPAKMTVSAPSGVQVQQNPDQSITMTIGLHGATDESKENIAPQRPQQQQQQPNMPPMFKVSKFSTKPEEQKPKPGIWTPSQAPTPARAPEPGPKPQDESRTTDEDNVALLPEEEAELKARLEALKKPVPNLLQKVLIDGSGSDREGTPDSPGYLSRRRSK